MKDSSQILGQLEQKIDQSPSGSLTAAGRPDKQTGEAHTEDLADAINQAFELLRVNYHHLFFSAYDEINALDAAKRLWLKNLSVYSPETIVAATHKLIKQSDYLPTVSQLVRQCQQITSGLTVPDVYSAYVEACRASNPKQNYLWSHPIVYYAGRRSDWFFLANNSEATALPIFKQHYQQLCQRLYDGESLPPIKPLISSKIDENSLAKTENAKRMAVLKEQFDDS